jgi:hypothetical protein
MKFPVPIKDPSTRVDSKISNHNLVKIPPVHKRTSLGGLADCAAKTEFRVSLHLCAAVAGFFNQVPVIKHTVTC